MAKPDKLQELKEKKFSEEQLQSALSLARTVLLAALNDISGDPARLLVDSETGSLRVNLWVWDTDNLQTVRQPLMDMAALTASINQLTLAVEKLEKTQSRLTDGRASC